MPQTGIKLVGSFLLGPPLTKFGDTPASMSQQCPGVLAMSWQSWQCPVTACPGSPSNVLIRAIYHGRPQRRAALPRRLMAPLMGGRRISITDSDIHSRYITFTGKLDLEKTKLDMTCVISHRASQYLGKTLSCQASLKSFGRPLRLTSFFFQVYSSCLEKEFVFCGSIWDPNEAPGDTRGSKGRSSVVGVRMREGGWA